MERGGPPVAADGSVDYPESELPSYFVSPPVNQRSSQWKIHSPFYLRWYLTPCPGHTSPPSTPPPSRQLPMRPYYPRPSTSSPHPTSPPPQSPPRLRRPCRSSNTSNPRNGDTGSSTRPLATVQKRSPRKSPCSHGRTRARPRQPTSARSGSFRACSPTSGRSAM